MPKQLVVPVTSATIAWRGKGRERKAVKVVIAEYFESRSLLNCLDTIRGDLLCSSHVDATKRALLSLRCISSIKDLSILIRSISPFCTRQVTSTPSRSRQSRSKRLLLATSNTTAPILLMILISSASGMIRLGLI